MSRPQTALVTGASGFIGSALTRRLLDENWSVVCLGCGERNRNGRHTADGIDRRIASTGTPDDLSRALAGVHPDVVFHLAAHGVHGPAAGHTLTSVQGNVQYCAALVDVLRECGARRFLYTGSCFEYGHCPDGHRWRETDRCVPFSVYGATKLAGEEVGRTAAAEYGLDFVSLRLFATYGPGESPRRLIPTLAHGLKAGQTVDLTSGTQVRDWLYVDDAVDALLHAALAPRLTQNTYNVCTGVGTSVRDVGEILRRFTRQPADLFRWGARPSRPNEPTWIVGDPSRFSAETGWSARWALARGLEQTLTSIDVANQAA